MCANDVPLLVVQKHVHAIEIFRPFHKFLLNFCVANRCAVWVILHSFFFVYFRTEAKSNVKKGNTATQQLLAWCQHKTKYYEVREQISQTRNINSTSTFLVEFAKYKEHCVCTCTYPIYHYTCATFTVFEMVSLFVRESFD